MPQDPLGTFELALSISGSPWDDWARVVVPHDALGMFELACSCIMISLGRFSSCAHFIGPSWNVSDRIVID